jgi:carboxylesterase type B
MMERYPVMVYIHGESFEWNSGSPYDGSVLASYTDVVVVTLNYRLGVLGACARGERRPKDRDLIDFSLVSVCSQVSSTPTLRRTSRLGWPTSV